MDKIKSNDMEQLLYSSLKMIMKFSSNGSNFAPVVASGFSIVKEGKMSLVTNRHVLDPSYSAAARRDWYLEEVEISYRDMGETEKGKLFQCNLDQRKIIYAEDRRNDVALCRTSDITVNNPAARASYAIPYSMLLSRDEFLSGSVGVGFDVFFSGYPEWHDAENVQPIMRFGKISTNPKVNYQSGQISGDVLLVEGFSYPGLSGAPVFTIIEGEYKLLGINAGSLREVNGVNLHSGLSYLFKSYVIKEIIDNMDE